jgi:FMN phosphatase YigB (HAD superfamily)
MFTGDNPEADIVGAKVLGTQTAWVHHGRGWPSELAPPDHVIGHVAELRRVLFTPQQHIRQE